MAEEAHMDEPKAEEKALDKLSEEALVDASGGVLKPPHAKKPREYESVGG